MKKNDLNLTCPLPLTNFKTIQMAHGGGGKIMNELLDNFILTQFQSPISSERNDSAVFELGRQKFAFTTDSYVIDPIFFPGGDIGSLAVHGTINDLAMVGAKPLFLSAGFILEEGFEISNLHKIVSSMKKATEMSGVHIITGDTKVVDKGKGDKIYINTAGIGLIEHDQKISTSQIKPGDQIIINGDIGRHGISVMLTREKLDFKSDIKSDSVELSSLVQELLKNGIEIHCMRDLTRGGLASSLVEIANKVGLKIEIMETNISVEPPVLGACEILGLDPLYIANEGRFICIVPEKVSEKALSTMRSHPNGINSQIIGSVTQDQNGIVVLKNTIGTSRIIDMLSGEQLPRIC